MKKSKQYIKLLLAIVLLIASTSCQKTPLDPTTEPVEMVTFKLNISTVTVQQSTFKSLDRDSIFNLFKQQYPADATISFKATDGTLYGPSDAQPIEYDLQSLPLDEETFILPVGDYTVTGACGITLNTAITYQLNYFILDQKVTITKDTKLLPITLSPGGYLILLADPYSQVDRSNTQNDAAYNYRGYIKVLRQFNNTCLRYIYIGCDGAGNSFGFTKIDNTRVDFDLSQFKAGYIYKIYVDRPPVIDSTKILIQVIPGFQLGDIQNY
jgi:hypothetical protein